MKGKGEICLVFLEPKVILKKKLRRNVSGWDYMKLFKEDFLNLLEEQIYFLNRSSEEYDRGYTMESKRLASHIRTLVHDTRHSTSLLKHLNCKTQMYFFNTAIPESKFGLCGMTTTTENGGRTFYHPPLGNLSEIRQKNPWVTFNTWWNEVKVLSDGKNKFSRKDLILALANKDGGAHVDKELEEPYAKLSRGNSMRVYHQNQSGILVDVFGVELASVRQITFELLRSIEEKFS